MNNKIVIQFTALTFIIAFAMWGFCEVFGLFGYTIENAAWLWVFIALCALSPTIASYIVLKRNNRVKSFKEWLKNCFAFKTSFRNYILVLILLIVYYVPQAIFTGWDKGQPFYMFFILIPLVLMAGGIEEIGWSYVLRPELDKKYGLIVSSLVIGVIWAVWHIPVFVPQGRLESLP